jgi:phage terminase Nu1 subunit (DNA packaging protein)
MTLNKQQLAAALGVSRPTIDAWIKEGLPVAGTPATNRRQGYRFNLDECRRWQKRRDSAIQQETEDRRGDIHQRIYEAVRREFWTLARPLLRPDDLRLIRDKCRDTDALIETSRRLSKAMHRRLVELADAMWIAEHPEDGPDA